MQDPEKQEEQPDNPSQNDELLAAQLAAESAENPDQSDQPQGESISAHVKADLVQQLMDMGFSKNVSEKSLFLTQSTSLENAMEWIDKHSEDPDFEEELRIVGQDLDNSRTDTQSSKPKYTAEERKQKAKELQQVIRKKRKEQEEALEKQRELDRIKGAKQMMKVKREIEDAQMHRDIQKLKWEKKEQAEAKARMLKLLQQDKISRFGKGGGGASGSVSADTKPSEPPQVTIKNAIKTIETIYTEVRHPGATKLCFKTINLYLSNILKDPTEEKFRSINLDNEGFKKRVGKLGGALKILKAAGFESDGTKLVMEKPEVERIKMAIKLLEGHF